MLLALPSVHPPLLVEGHGGGRAYAMRYVGGRYREGERVFGGIDEPEGTTFSPGPAMRYAKVDALRVRVYHREKRLGTWRLPGAKIVAWWNLPIVARGRRVDRLLPEGRIQRLPLDGHDLKAVLPGRSGALFALYSTKSHWRVLRRGRRGDRWTPWQPGPLDTCAPTRERLFVSAGDDGFGPFGREELWSYDFRRGATTRLRRLPYLATISFDSPWVRPDHLASVLYTHPWGSSSTNYPYRTDLLRLRSRLTPLASVPSGWMIYDFDAAAGEFLGLHINRRNFGYDLQRVRLRTLKEIAVAGNVDALDISTPSSYSSLVND